MGWIQYENDLYNIDMIDSISKATSIDTEKQELPSIMMFINGSSDVVQEFVFTTEEERDTVFDKIAKVVEATVVG